MRQKLVSGACCAIRMRSYETDVKKAVELLNRDLLNGPLHCFGIHFYFCTVAREKQEPSNSNTQNSQSASSSKNDDQPASSSSIFNESGVGVAAPMMKMMTTLKVCMEKVSEIKKI